MVFISRTTQRYGAQYPAFLYPIPYHHVPLPIPPYILLSLYPTTLNHLILLPSIIIPQRSHHTFTPLVTTPYSL